MPLPTWTLRATYVPRGARVADGLTLELYSGPDEAPADRWLDFLHEFASWSRCGGRVLLLKTEDKEVWWDTSIPCHAHDAEWHQPSGGYPSHGCGKPLVPGDIVGQALKPRELFCVGCYRAVEASPDERLRATTAASHERQAARAP